MKPIVKYGIAGAAILTLGLLVCKNCVIYQERGVLLGEINVLKAQNKKIAVFSDKKIAESKKEIAAKDKAIALLTTEVGHANTIIGQLRGDYAALDEAYRVANTCPEKLTLALRQIVNLQNQVNIRDSIIADKDKIIASWGDKFTAQVGISAAWEAKFNSERNLRLKEEALIKSLNTSLRICRLTGTLKTGLVVGAGLYIIARLTGVMK